MNTSILSKAKKPSKEFFRDRLNVRHARHTPAVNIQEKEQEYLIKLAAPGFSREELAVNIKRNTISIASLRKSLRPDNELCKKSYYEYDFSQWERKFELPADAEAMMAHAFYVNGELLIHIPKYSQPQIVDFMKVIIY
jgi:HSP20 family protein